MSNYFDYLFCIDFHLVIFCFYTETSIGLDLGRFDKTFLVSTCLTFLSVCGVLSVYSCFLSVVYLRLVAGCQVSIKDDMQRFFGC